MSNSKVFLAELIGTFALVFFGAGAAVSGLTTFGVALAHGLTLAVMAYTFGYISGTHINPAVTFGLALQGAIQWSQAAVYWAAQFSGAIAAAAVLNFVASDFTVAATAGSMTLAHPVTAMIIEAILTFFLVNTILHTAVGGKGGAFAGWAIGTTLTVAILGGGHFTGASLNPARTFGPALFTGDWMDGATYLIYFVGPFVGSAIAVAVYRFFTSADAPMMVAASVMAETKKPAAKKPAAKRK